MNRSPEEATSARRSASVDVLRAVAALSVLWFHSVQFAGAGPPENLKARSLFYDLDSGLVLFFVISGYLISGPFVRALLIGRPVPDTRRYALRRVSRIIPAYWIALGFCVLALPFTPGAPGAQGVEHLWQVPAFGALIQDLIPGQFQGLLQVAWTLDNEILFYLLVPLAAVWIRRRRGDRVSPEWLAGAVLSVWAFSVTFVLLADQLPAFSNGAAIARYGFPATVGLFCPGILVAVAQARAQSAGPGPVAWLRARALRAHSGVLVGLVLCAMGAGVNLLAVVTTQGNLIFIDGRWPFFAAGFGLLLLAMVESGERMHRVTRWLAPVGLVSYGIYLWHTIVIRVLGNLGWYFSGSVISRPLNMLLVAAVTIPVAALSYLVIERPALNWAAVVPLPLRLRRQPAAVEPSAVDTSP